MPARKLTGMTRSNAPGSLTSALVMLVVLRLDLLPGRRRTGLARPTHGLLTWGPPSGDSADRSAAGAAAGTEVRARESVIPGRSDPLGAAAPRLMRCGMRCWEPAVAVGAEVKGEQS